MEVIPAIDMLEGRCVRLMQGDYARVTHYDIDVLEFAVRCREAGLTRMHVVDLDGARDGIGTNGKTIGRIVRDSGLRVQVGGGIRTLSSARAWLNAGAERVVVGSLAVLDSADVIGWLAQLPRGSLVPAFDVRVGPDLAAPVALTHGWRADGGHALWELLERYRAAGIDDFLCTDVARDGTLAGANLQLYAEAVRREPGIRLIASGGVSSAADLAPLAATGVVAVVTGRALLDGRLTLAEVARFSRAA